MPWLLPMGALIACSAFFSASETALFSLRPADLRALRSGGRSRRAAARLLDDPERLLTAVLFWNLVINIAYFTIVSIAGLQLHADRRAGDSAAAGFGAAALLAIIFCSEMLPKSLAVLAARRLAGLVGLPLALAVRLVDPLMPVLRVANLLSRRLIWPHFEPEPYLHLSDLERAVATSTSDAELIEQEQTALRNIVQLSDIRVDEWMRPRTQFQTFRPPVSLDQLQGRMTPSGYLLVTESDSEEVAGAIDLKDLIDVPERHLEHLAQPVVYIPWCTVVADAFQQMQLKKRDVAVVVNEFGESIGILTIDDILDSIFTVNPTRSSRLLNREAIQEVSAGVWHVTGMTSLRRLARHFQTDLPPSKSVTVAGMVEESLQRLAEPGDACRWGDLLLTVIEVPHRGPLVVELRRQAEASGS